MKLEIVLNASVGSMLAMPSGLSGRYCWSVTIANVASHMKTFEISSETRVLLPVLLLVRIDAGEAQHEPLDRHEDRIEQRALPREHLRHVAPERQARGDGEEDREDDGDVFGAHDASELLRAQHRVHEVHERATLKTNDNRVMTSPTRGRTA